MSAIADFFDLDELAQCSICNCELPHSRHGQLIKCRQCGAWVCDGCYVYRGSVCVQCGDRPCHERTLEVTVDSLKTVVKNWHAARAAAVAENLAGLPQLAGSEKQVKWATEIRQRQIEHLVGLIMAWTHGETANTRIFSNRPEVAEAELAGLRRAVYRLEFVRSTTSAKFFIETRSQNLATLADDLWSRLAR